MAQDYFAILGLAPGRYRPEEITRRFCAERERLLDELDGSHVSFDAHRRLDELHLAHSALRNAALRREQPGSIESAEPDDLSAMRELISASLEDGLLRYSRRQLILDEGRQRGFSDFQIQLLIAQVQFGDDLLLPLQPGDGHRRIGGERRIWASAAAVGVLALAMFLLAVRWLQS